MKSMDTWLSRLMMSIAGMVLLMTGLMVNSAKGQFLMMPDSTNNRLVLFDPFNGSVVNSNFFGLQAGTPIRALQVGNQIWVSEQVGDRISRWDFNGNHLGNIGGQFAGGGLDNIRGMELINNTIYVTNAGTLNNAPGAAVVMFDTNGNNLGFFNAAGLAPSPFSVIEHQGGLLVASSSANDDIHRFDLVGSSLGTFHNSATLNFAHQLIIAANGDVLAAGFSSNNVVRMDPNTGATISTFTAGGARGVYQLGNGNILWTSGTGAHVYDVNLGTSSQVYVGDGRHVGFVTIPEPAAGLLLSSLGLGLTLLRRRRS
ncbi:MAG TPA: PEP-CTERM sorting domain-containing protein [Pirellulaceae bacterium]|nr:PEP-CTERM sorting domain-containing protein [Pirellulaceae bacterium]HMO93028.1 PEP-CTERM sorting domain-containing protein [Pirellulaceae bacterium]HMP69658.1 PEP-CTERM sorting domain-containing protein [Pirellulaceae bacterium]